MDVDTAQLEIGLYMHRGYEDVRCSCELDFGLQKNE